MRILLLLFFVLPLLAQAPFYVKQDTVQMPENALKLQIQASSFPLNCTIFRIHDPVNFLTKQDNIHKIVLENTPIREELNQAIATSKENNKPQILGNAANIPAEQLNFSYVGMQEIKELTRNETGYAFINFNIKDSGVYLVETVKENYIAYALSAISDLAMIVRRANNQTLVYTVHRTTGHPYSNTKVSIFLKGKLLEQKISNEQGIAIFQNLKYSPQIQIFAQNGSDFTCDDPFFFPALVSGYKGYIFTERPLYLPEETVNFKGILREWQNGDYIIPKILEKKLDYIVTDAQNNTIFTGECNVHSEGTFEGTFPLQKNLSMGQCQIAVKWNEKSFQTEFQVQQFTKPQFQVSVKPVKNIAVAGEELNFEISATYFSGAPVLEGNVKIQLSQSRFDQPLFEKVGLESFYSQSEYRSFKSKQLKEERLELKNGVAKVKFTSLSSEESHYYRLQAVITDKSRNVGVGSASVKVMPTDVRFDIKTNKHLYSLEEQIQIIVKAVDLQNKPIAQSFSIELVRKGRQYPKGGSAGSPWMRQELPDVPSQSITVLQGKTDDKGNATLEYPATMAGEIEITLTAKDRRGKTLSLNKNVWASQSNEPLLYSGDMIRVILDKNAYSIGETAKVLVILPTSNISPLITWESANLLMYQVQAFSSNALMLSIPIASDMVPNVYFRISAIAENGFMECVQSIQVPPINKMLKLEITSDKSTYKPREQVILKIKARDDHDQPVSTNLSISIVDSAIYALASDSNAPLALFFYPLQRKNVASSSSIQMLSYDHAKYSERLNIIVEKQLVSKGKSVSHIADDEDRYEGHATAGAAETEAPMEEEMAREEAERPRPSPTRLMAEDSAPTPESIPANEAPSRSVESRPEPSTPAMEPSKKSKEKSDSSGDEQNVLERSLFQSTAAWFAIIQTNLQGEAEVKFTIPDNLTDWQITVKTVDSNTRVGETTSNISSRMPVYLLVNHPEFLICRDQLQWELAACNATGNTQELKLSTQFSRNLQAVPVNITQKVATGNWLRSTAQIEAINPGAAILSAQVTSKFSDATKYTIPVYTHGVRQVHSDSGLLIPEKQQTIELFLPESVASAKLSIRLYCNYVAMIQDSLKMLVGYPYGCVEQTMSRFMPNLVAKQIIQAQLGENAIDLKELDKNIAAGLKRLYELQQEDGGWGWWEADQSDPMITAYVFSGLARCQKLGYNVEKEKLSKATQCLKNLLSSSWSNKYIIGENFDKYAAMAYICYALSIIEDVPQSTLEELFDTQERSQASPYTMALLALSLYKNHPEEAEQILKDIAAKAKSDSDGIYWGEKQDYRWYTNSVEVTAIITRSFIAIAPHHELIPKALSWLASQRKDQGWNSTKDTSEVICTFCTYLEKEAGTTTDAKVKINMGKMTKEILLNKSATVYTISQEMLKRGSNKLTLETSNKGIAYTAAIEFLTLDEPILANKQGLSVDRKYFLLQKNSQNDEQVVYDQQPLPTTPINDGETILCVLEFSLPKSYDFVMLQDPIPATAQIIREDRNIDLSQPIVTQPYTHREFQHHQAVFFFRHLSAGTYQVAYFFRTNFAGKFHALPSQISLMYYPEICGNSQEDIFIVK